MKLDMVQLFFAPQMSTAKFWRSFFPEGVCLRTVSDTLLYPDIM